MANENPVSQLLVPTGNQALLTIGQRETALAVGQLGIFNYHTGLSVDGTVPGDAQDIYLAVGVNRTGAGGGATLEDVNRSAGQVIQKRHLNSVTAKAYIAAAPKIIEIGAFGAKCETDYGVKVEFRNQKIYGISGYNQFAKTFTFRTGCCVEVDCSSCPQGDCNELAIGIVTNINLDADALVTASLFINKITATVAAEPTAAGTIVVTIGTTAYSVAIVDADTVTTAAAKIVAVINTQTDSPYRATSALGVMSIYPKTTTVGSTETLVYTTTVAGMTITPIVAATKTDVTDTAAFIAAVPGACMAIRLTGAADAPALMNSSIPIKYYAPRGTDMIVSLVEGFACNGTVTTIQELQYEEGAGQDVQFEEYMDGGLNGKPGPYRTSAVTGLTRTAGGQQNSGIELFGVAATHYSTFTLTYEQKSNAGWGEYFNSLETRIAILCSDTTTIQGLFTMLDLIFTQFTPFTNDVAGFDCTNVSTNLINNPALDGIESLS